MKKHFLLIFTAFMLSSVAIKAQNVRYIDSVITSVSVDSNVVYGTNYTILNIILQRTTRTTRQPLTMNVHKPTTDTETKRPLVIVFHSGNFLPQALTQNYSGSKEDSVVSTLCRQFAHRGYVAASATYRIGWNPTDPNQDNRTSLLINASYKGVQDARTAIRFFKANATTYGIDTTKIMLLGVGTGGYITLGAATLNEYNQILGAKYPANKFINSATGLPMVIERLPPPAGYVHGDIEGKFLGTVPAGTVPPVGDTLNLPNHVANTSDFAMCVNLGGAVGDLTWVDTARAATGTTPARRATVPILTFHAPYDQFAPYTTLTLRVATGPGTSLPVVEVQGGLLVQRRMDSLGLNNVFKRTIAAKYNPYKTIFETRAGGAITGLFPILGDTISDSSPWDFVGPTSPFASSILNGAPRSSRARALRYIDTVMTVVLPRACLALKLPCAGVVTSTEELLQSSTTKLTASPNPARTAITFESEAVNPMQAIQLFDMAGRQVMAVKVNSHNYTLSRNGLPSGMYVAKVKFEGGILTKKIVFEE
ncbi:MAG: T9SS type A sorting domain-containing protein [Saprospiraceae bacterium]|nr:T9SS type A sorting domain-containing protein [Saprospiraceae bacterium]